MIGDDRGADRQGPRLCGRRACAVRRARSYTDYGALSGRSVDDMIAGARVEVAPFKEDPMDFVLWKPSDARRNPAGTAPGARVGPAGTSNARPWRMNCWAKASTSTAAGSTCNSPTTRTRSPSPLRHPARRLRPRTGCTTRCCRSRARRCPSPGQLLHGAGFAGSGRAGRGDPLRLS